MLELKGYQQRSLNDLEKYLRQAVTIGAKAAFVMQTERPYRAVPNLPELPYVCLRIPTGGGKTLMACHALGIAAKEFLRQDHAVCLWLVPSKPIREQTLKALRNRKHPYRQGLEAKLSGPLEVMDLTEALYVQKGQLIGQTVVIVSTLQALRVTDTEGRKVYETSGALQHHFSGLPEPLLAELERNEDGTFPYSLANVLRLHRPVVIMDEAHNARTTLSFDTLSRLDPSCVIEFTATPETTYDPARGFYASNVLSHCSAFELKTEDMIKLPVKLETTGDPRQAISHAHQMRQALEKTALEEEKKTGEYLRPIVLLQAEPRGEGDDRFTVDRVKQCLVSDFKVPEEQIAIAIGIKDEIEGVTLSERTCPVRYIITVQKLKEGWDCPFAYILCSVQKVHSARAVEQVLGRVLRLPHARLKTLEDLNCAYAFISSTSFEAAARSLKDALVENGFEHFEADTMVQPVQTDFLGDLPLYRGPIVEPVDEKPDLSKLEKLLRDKITFDEPTFTIRVQAIVSDADLSKLEKCFSTVSGKDVAERILARRRAGLRPVSPSERRLSFSVPHLAIRVDGQLEIFEEDCFLGATWKLTDADATLTETQFPSTLRSRNAAAFDFKADGSLDVELTYADILFQQLSFVSGERGWTLPALVNWLDRQIPHLDLTRTQCSLFINRVVAQLMESRNLTVEQLAAERIRLRAAVALSIDEIRQKQRKRGFQHMLFDGGGEIEVSPNLCFSFPPTPDRYPANAIYQGPLRLPKHYYPRIADMNGEEAECASCIAELDEVEYWVRNIERREETSFWLQTSTDKFYPDFVAKLKDGHILVVEYKGEYLWSNDDSKEKRAVGDLWAHRSGGRCLFIMPKGKDFASIVGILRPA
jgi:type III restriction enzyme